MLTGCAGVLIGGAAGAGTMAYVRGELRDQLRASPAETREAIREALRDLELETTREEADRLSGTFKARTGGDKDVTIYYKRIESDITEIRIRIGTFGDEDLSRTILRKIEDNL
jgi:uncharacterized protein YpuA (DUF1002 family)